MTLAVAHHLAHMREVILIVLAGVLRRVLFQDLDDSTAAIVTHRLAAVAAPASRLGELGLEPVLELACRHVDNFIELLNLVWSIVDRRCEARQRDAHGASALHLQRVDSSLASVLTTSSSGLPILR